MSLSAMRESVPMGVAVGLVWLLLVGEISVAQVLLAILLGALLPLIDHHLRPDHAHMRRPLTFMRLTAVVLYDIVKSNINVARLILGRESKLRPAFIWVAMDIQNPYGIAALTGIITMTPGTVSVLLSDDRHYLLLHCLDAADPVAVAREIKTRYERPLMEIFP
ncbi:MAG: Na+/H+ antiporter subunit E [Lysobacteraceae bacterium]